MYSTLWVVIISTIFNEACAQITISSPTASTVVSGNVQVSWTVGSNISPQAYLTLAYSPKSVPTAYVDIASGSANSFTSATWSTIRTSNYMGDNRDYYLTVFEEVVDANRRSNILHASAAVLVTVRNWTPALANDFTSFSQLSGNVKGTISLNWRYTADLTGQGMTDHGTLVLQITPHSTFPATAAYYQLSGVRGRVDSHDFNTKLLPNDVYSSILTFQYNSTTSTQYIQANLNFNIANGANATIASPVINEILEGTSTYIRLYVVGSIGNNIGSGASMWQTETIDVLISSVSVTGPWTSLLPNQPVQEGDNFLTINSVNSFPASTSAPTNYWMKIVKHSNGAELDHSGPFIVDNSKSGTRAFFMGFTNFPWGVNVSSALTTTAGFIQHHGDIISFHLPGSESVPWVEALNGNTFSTNLINEYQAAVTGLGSGQKLLLGLTPGRGSTLSPYWGSSNGQALPPPWNTYDFCTTNVQTAYFNYVDRAIGLLGVNNVIGVGLAVEASLQYFAGPYYWECWIKLHIATYNAVKTKYPSLLVFFSFETNIVNSPMSVDAAKQLYRYSDVLALSTYPYYGDSTTDRECVGNDCYTLTPRLYRLSFYDGIARLARSMGKPWGIHESGFPNTNTRVTYYDGTQNNPFVSTTTTLQTQFIANALNKAYLYDTAFIVNWAPINFKYAEDSWYDQCVASGKNPLNGNCIAYNLGQTWEYTGLADGNWNAVTYSDLPAFPALAVWDSYKGLSQTSLSTCVAGATIDSCGACTGGQSNRVAGASCYSSSPSGSSSVSTAGGGTGSSSAGSGGGGGSTGNQQTSNAQMSIHITVVVFLISIVGTCNL